MAPKFKYRNLDNDREFRTLVILGERDGMLRCQLAHHSLPSRLPESESFEYDAVSWFWGVDERLTSIYIVDDDGQDKLFSVRPNLVEALRGLRDKESITKRFWIDALCINQDNTHERDLQVQHMFEIYSKAQNVCIWLGDHDNQSELALKFIEERVCDLGAFEKVTRDESAKEEWKALAALMNRPWFSRRWVVQELALAKRATVHCGEKFVNWADFETAVALFERDAPKIAMHFRGAISADYDHDYFGDVANMRATRLVQAKSNLFRMNDRGEIMEYRFTLSDLVSNLSFFGAKEPHDLIYAILSLAKDTHNRMRIVPPMQDQTPAPKTPEPIENTKVFSFEPVSASPPVASTPGFHQLPDTNGTEVNTNKRKSTHELDFDRLTKAQQTVLKRVGDKFKHSIQPENTEAFPPVNYNQPFFNLCKEFLGFTIPKNEYPNLDILCRPWAPEAPKEEAGLPSWIPRVANAAFGIRNAEYAPGRSQIKRKNADPLVGQTTDGTPYYNASRSMKAERGEWRFGEPSKGEDAYSLFVTGFVLDQIGPVEDASQNGHIPLEWIQLGGWDPWKRAGEQESERDAPDALWRTLVADRGPNGGNTKVYYRKAFEYAVTHSTVGVGLQTADLKQRGNSILLELLSRMEAVVWNRRLFRSDREDFLGLAPKGARQDICIVRGCSVPVILRKVQGSSHHVFIGECYLHTMMNGQAVNIQEGKVKEWRDKRKKSDGPMSMEERLMTTHIFELR